MKRCGHLDTTEYKQLHKNRLAPLSLKIDLDLFEKEMDHHKFAFRQWGVEHSKYHRYGAPLVNLNGSMYNNPEPACYPLNQWNDLHPDNIVKDIMCTTPTELLSISSLDPLEELKPYMIRSCILKWHTAGHFKPHTDTKMPSNILRFWGANKHMKLRFEKSGEYVRPRDVDVRKKYDWITESVEPGRLYLFDSAIVHDAEAVDDNTYQFFLAFNTNAGELIKNYVY